MNTVAPCGLWKYTHRMRNTHTFYSHGTFLSLKKINRQLSPKKTNNSLLISIGHIWTHPQKASLHHIQALITPWASPINEQTCSCFRPCHRKCNFAQDENNAIVQTNNTGCVTIRTNCQVHWWKKEKFDRMRHLWLPNWLPYLDPRAGELTPTPEIQSLLIKNNVAKRSRIWRVAIIQTRWTLLVLSVSK